MAPKEALGTARDILTSRFGFGSFLPGQEQVVSALLADPPGSAIAVFPTGGGKSLTYQLPAVALAEAGEGTTLVVSPLIALMKDQIDALRWRGVPAARLDSSLSVPETREVEAGLRSGELALLYVSPERFNNERFLSLIGEARISLFAVDEAHCISEWGHAFRPDYLKLARIAADLAVPRTLALTATATPQVVEDMAREFEVPEENRVVTGFFRPNIKLLTTAVSAENRDALLVRRLGSEKRPPSATIVYVTLQKTAEEVAERLAAEGLPARAYHAGMDSEERTRVQEWWSASPDGIVVATIAFGMGIDRPDVRYVYHYNCPKSLENYSQEIGRAGRDGEESVAEAFVCSEDVPVLENFAHGDTPTEESVRGTLEEVIGDREPGAEVALNLYSLTARHDVRMTVLKTLLTYLELGGFLRQKTPTYATYQLRLSTSVDEVPERVKAHLRSRADEHAADRGARLAADVLAVAKPGMTWRTFDASEAAARAGAERGEIVKLVSTLQEAGLAEVRARDVRHNYEITHPVSGNSSELSEVSGKLHARFARREEREISRVREVLSFAASESCQWRALCARFGQTLTESCGGCSSCAGVPSPARRVPEPEIHERPDVRERVRAMRPELDELAADHREALEHPRQKARFLAGLTSPALAKARITKHPRFGALSPTPFRVLLSALEDQS